MHWETKRPWVVTACAVALLAVAGVSVYAMAGDDADDDKIVEHKRVVVKTSDGGPEQIWVSDSDGELMELDGSGRSWLGIGLREETKLSEGGARVTMVVEDSPADKAGIKKGDVIVGFQGDVIRGPAKLTEKIHETKAGQSVKLDIMRDGSKRTVTAEIGERKSGVRVFGPGWSGDWDGEALSDEQKKAVEESLQGLHEKMPELQRKLSELDRMRAPRAYAYGFGGARGLFFDMNGPKLGVELVQVTPELREHLGSKSEAGVLVGKVLPNSAAEKAGVKVGDLIVTAGMDEIEDAGDLIEAVHDNAGKTVDIEVVREGRKTKVKALIPEAPAEDAARGPRAAIWAAPVAPPAPPAPPAAPAPPAPPAPVAYTIL